MNELKFFKKYLHTMIKGDNLNWHERNSGNMTYRLTAEEAEAAAKHYNVQGRVYELPMEVPGIAGDIFLVTGSGKYFMNALIDTDEVVGFCVIGQDGKSYEIVWGFENDNMPTSELPAHLLIHQQLKNANEGNRTVYHCHPTHLNIMTYVNNYDSYEFSSKLWKYATEASVFVPKGVGLLKWMMPGSIEIGMESSKMLEEFNIVCWVHHGVFAAGSNPDETLGTVHVAEKAAEIFYKVNSMNIPEINTIQKQEIVDLVTTFGIDANPSVIEKL
ncbi:rhamnulose-1-phosphate aldolase [Mollicutes bacterium LVI A0039]|nr:rhamnulose-1-phosphate aldolase [Mollicutes bacterium LVI A0039]